MLSVTVRFLSFLQRLSGSAPATSDPIEHLARDIEGLPPERARFIAAFAFLLSRIAAADHEVTADEANTLERMVREKGGLPAAQAAAVVQHARTHQQRSGGTDDFLVTREFAQTASYDEKLALIDCLFAVAASDTRIRTTESNEIGRIATGLRVEQRDLSRIRNQYREFLAAKTVE
jgi:uncharacterized tellurite resistance protein B-like protein